jgi:nitrate reductase alpha subunit
MSETDAAKAGIVDNDWVEAFNANGALVARAVVSQRMKEGTLFMYHAQEKHVNVPGSPLTGQRGGIHNSVTRAVLKPTHMIGGYVQQAMASTITAPSGPTAMSSSSSANLKRSTGSKERWPKGRQQHESPRPDREGAQPR